MQIELNRRRILIYAAITGACAIGAWLALILLFSAGATGGAVVGAVIGIAVVLTLYTAFYLIGFLRRQRAVVAITETGIAFNIPGIGKIEWDRVEDAEVRKLGGGQSLAVYVREPAPRPGFLNAAIYGFSRRKTEKGVRLALPLGRLQATEAEIEAAIAEHRPA